MDQLQYFNFKGVEVRTVMQNGQPWWVAKDVCEILEIQNTTQALQRLDDDERSMFNIGRQGEVNVVNEYGLYALILSSRKPEAREFKRWITHEVLPQIRQTGSYVAPKSQAEVSLMLAQTLVDQEKKMKELEQQIEIANHRINMMDRTDIQGDEQQIFNKMIRKYAALNGVTFQRAYRDFKGAFNVAYRTNITMLHENYKMNHNPEATLPQFLVATGRIEDALRVADKMLNPSA